MAPKSEAQRKSHENWMKKPGVRDEQRKKDRERKAAQRAKEKAERDAESDRDVQPVPERTSKRRHSSSSRQRAKDKAEPEVEQVAESDVQPVPERTSKRRHSSSRQRAKEKAERDAESDRDVQPVPERTSKRRHSSSSRQRAKDKAEPEVEQVAESDVQPESEHTSSRSSSLLTIRDPSPLLQMDSPNDSVTLQIRNLRSRFINWTLAYNWGPANLWETEFYRLLDEAKELKEVDEFLADVHEHARKGRKILTDLKYIGRGTCIGEHGVFIDLFVQGLEMAVDIASEVKYFEVKLDEHSPFVSHKAQSRLRHRSSE